MTAIPDVSTAAPLTKARKTLAAIARAACTKQRKHQKDKGPAWAT